MRDFVDWVVQTRKQKITTQNLQIRITPESNGRQEKSYQTILIKKICLYLKRMFKKLFLSFLSWNIFLGIAKDNHPVVA